MFDLLRPYVTLIRLWCLIVAAVLVSGYIGYLHYRIQEAEKDIHFLKDTVRVCDEDRSRLRETNRIQAENLNAIDRYYRSRSCLNLRDGELTPEELRLQ